MNCTGQRKGGDWIINGTKHFISHADIADFVIVFIATGEEETEKGKRKNLLFSSDRGTPGFEICSGYNSVSHRGYKNCILRFEDVDFLMIKFWVKSTKVLILLTNGFMQHA